MEYTVLTMKWKNQMTLTGFSAVRLDEKLHKINDLCSTKTENEQEVSKEDWVRLCDSINPSGTMILWSRSQTFGIKYVESRAKRRLPYGRLIGISELGSSMISLPKQRHGLETYMSELGLTCDPRRLSDSYYEAQCQVRLFRKLKKMEAEMYGDLKEEQEVQSERDRKILYVIRKMDQKSRIDRDMLFFHTVHCTFEFNLHPENKILQYHTTRFYRGEREVILENMENLDWPDKAWKIQQTARELEHQQCIGVGNNTMNLLVDKLAQKMEDIWSRITGR